ncbi:bifunctional glutamate--cysteine ligase GshA/glutathione synthetase GshB [Enterococcus sp. JM9B]|uniref:bifunctional glutamate--cysteine ligase GshA/glutathione synthetase GshB n=1 Tax=Enterococcus sp. JM9B TaxID=1857216 RepID=UPI001374E3FA|nr:bifunctional glutamate--cysteine ligase GshA/glutathione synthetase GshB [Enterococcus sp. JM9B]KAF1300890.1 bifunctional glutamate--cysteine ligase/glutathione synthetase [Enterococcus sp. JM9B]
MNYQQLLKNEFVQPYLLQARFGVEKESQRIDLEGNLATTDHPQILGNRSYHPYIQTDFAETQMELITPVATSSSELMRWLAAIHDVAYRSMSEMLWPLSMPPALPEKEEAIILAKLDAFEDVLYRRYLAKEYGRRKQMVSGIHFNFEFAEKLIMALFDQQTEISECEAFKTELYLRVTRNYLRYRWLITYLYGASPVSEARYFLKDGPKEPVRSIRSSEYGYTNHENVQVSYSSLPTYLENIAQMVEEGKLSEEKEFYAPVRLRGGKKVADLKETGIRYIELRNIDLNPFAPYGIDQEQVDFLHIFMLFMLWKEEEKTADEWVAEGNERNNRVALEHPASATEYLAEGQQILSEMKQMAAALHLPLKADFFQFMEEALQDPSQTLAAALYHASQETSQTAVATALAKQNHENAWKKPYQLAGFRQMELSTQIFMFDGIQKGVLVEVLDEQDQFLKLQFAEHVEYVKNANMTSKDRYVVPLMMANKTVTKKVLAQAGFRVPEGEEFTEKQEALRAYPRFAKQGIVVKPKSTNYGLGISIFKDGVSEEDYETAVAIAFAEDRAILVEEFLPGTEYRFFVLDGKVQGIMLRVPANIVGDGKQTIAELVAEKNRDPLRGTNHRAPLELIKLGEVEKLMLKAQGYTPESIPEKEVVVYLRENSNVSTGGDSIDVTDEFSNDYKQIAVAAVNALGAKISGIDLVIPDKTHPANEKQAYGIIEANFNPAMHMHVYPYAGKGQRLTLKVLNFLFPEIN